MTAIFTIPAKLAASSLNEINVFCNKSYDVVNSVHDITSKILSSDSNFVVDVIMWPKLGKSSSFTRIINIASLYKYLTKKRFFRGVVSVVTQ